MLELFKTVLILSLFGFGLTALLLCLKPITAKKFPAKWQYYVWIAVLLSMIVPAYRLIPVKKVAKLPIVPQIEITQHETVEEMPKTVETEETPALYKNVNIAPRLNLKLIDLLSYIWLTGVFVYLTIVIASYIVYTIRKRNKSVLIPENDILNEVKTELKIKRHIKVRISGDLESPMLIGVVRPVIYIPCKEIPHEHMRMVFLHELTHYKRKDLLIKWLSLFVNAVHWFNPFAYLLCANISESCEILCDMEVTKNMSDTHQKIYMKTILDLAQ